MWRHIRKEAGMKNFAIIQSGFIGHYAEYFLDLCAQNGINVDFYTRDKNLKSLKNVKNIFYFDFNINCKKVSSIKKLNLQFEELLKDKNYDFILTDGLPLSFSCNVFHIHSIIHRMLLSPNFLYRLIFYLGHLKKINFYKNYFEKQPMVFVVSNLMKDDYNKNCNIPREKISVLTPGVEIPEVNEYKFPIYDKEQDFIIGMSACGFVTKGGFILLDAVRRLKRRFPKIKAKIIYPGHRKNWGLKLYMKLFNLKDNVEFSGYQKDMKTFYQSCNCWVVPSLCEAFGRIVPEAMLMGVPVIAGSNTGAKDIIVDGENGLIFQMNKYSGEDLAKKLYYLIENYDEIQPLIKKAYTTAKSCTWKNFAKEMFEKLFKYENL